MASIAPAMGDHTSHSGHWEQEKTGGVLNLAVCSNPGPAQKKARSKRKNESLSLSSTLCAAIVKHQLGELFEHQHYIKKGQTLTA